MQRAALIFGCGWVLASFVGLPAHAQKPVAKPAKVATAGKPASAETAKPAPARLAPAWSVAFSPDGKRILVGGYKVITLYDAESGDKVGEWQVAPEAVRSLVFSPEGDRIAAGIGVAGKVGKAVVLDAATGKPVRTVDGHTDTVESVAFAGRLLLTASSDEKIQVTDVATGKTTGTLSEHTGRCLAVAVPLKTSENAGGEIFATGGSDNMLKIWDARAQRVVVNFDQCASPVWSVVPRPVPGRFIAGSGDGRILYFGVRKDPDGSAESNGGIPPRTGFLERQFAAHEGGVYALAASPDDKFLVSGGADSKAVLWNMGGGKRRELVGAAGDIWGVAVSPDSQKVATASMDGIVRVYDSEKGKLLLELPAAPKEDSFADAPAVGLLYSPTPRKGKGLQALYYPNTEVSGKPILNRVDPTVDFLFTEEAGPAPGVSGVNFSGRWTGWVEAPVNGVYTFQTLSDDGVRLWVNSKLLIDNWTDHGTTEDTTPALTLFKGQVVPIRLEFYQGYGEGELRLRWSVAGAEARTIPADLLYPKLEPVAEPAGSAKRLVAPEKERGKGTGLVGQYFNNPKLEEKPVAEAVDPVVEFVTDGTKPYRANVPATQFSVRWKGWVEAPVTGIYEFSVLSDDGTRLTVDDSILINDWIDRSSAESRGQVGIPLVAGQRIPLVLEYFQGAGPGEVKLRWSYPGQETQVIPQKYLYSESTLKPQKPAAKKNPPKKQGKKP